MSNTASGFGNHNDDDGSVDMILATATTSKKRRVSDEKTNWEMQMIMTKKSWSCLLWRAHKQPNVEIFSWITH